MRERLISAAVLVPVVVIVFLLGNPWWTFAIAALAGLAAYEASGLVRRAGFESETWLAVVFAVASPIALQRVLPNTFFESRSELLTAATAGWAAAIVIVSGIVALRHRDPLAGFRAWVGTLFAAGYATLLSFVIGIVIVAPAIPETALLHGRIDDQRAWLLIVVLTVWALDTFAYVAGRFHGRGRFMNHISPNKTWSGVVGGTAAALLVCTVLAWAAGHAPLAGIAFGAVIAISAQAGDLVESMLKRAAGAKDSGTLIPGHGGILDRVDSFLFAAPAAFIALVVGEAVFRG
jgi:phosphatidate cytidylyltransferase